MQTQMDPERKPTRLEVGRCGVHRQKLLQPESM
jgi:hypothetical protein